MDQPREYVGAILNACWLVRHYRRGGRLTGMQRELRAKAIVALGAVVRDAFNKSQDYESLLEAVVDGLRPNDTPPF